MVLSHPKPCLHSPCNISFGSKIKGATNPKGSYKELMTDKIRRREEGLSGNAILNPNSSSNTFQYTSRTRSFTSTSNSWNCRDEQSSVAGMDCKTYSITICLNENLLSLVTRAASWQSRFLQRLKIPNINSRQRKNYLKRYWQFEDQIPFRNRKQFAEVKRLRNKAINR